MKLVRQAIRNWERLREISRLVALSEPEEGRSICLYHPRTGWYAEHAAEMLELLQQAADALERETGLFLPPNAACYATDPETAISIQGVAGAAYRDLTIIGFRERCLSNFAGTAAHELAHLCSRSLGKPETPFKAEGFATYWAARLGYGKRATGLPVHYHPAWMLHVGLRTSLEELWPRRDYTPELYDLAWSFTEFLMTCYGQERYYAFYHSGEQPLQRRTQAALDTPLPVLERQWQEYLREQVPVAPASISRMHRSDGATCSRAGWLRRSG